MSYLLTETGDVLLTELGERILLDEVVGAELAATFTLRLTASAALAPVPGAALTATFTIALSSTAALTVGPVESALAATFTIQLSSTGTLTEEAARLSARFRILLLAGGGLVNAPGFRELRDDDIQRPFGRLEQTDPAPVAVVADVLRWSIESSLDTPADGWSAEVAGASMMLGVNDEALYRLPMGFLDGTGQEVLAAHITAGRIVDRRLVGRATERRTYLRGVDALERAFRIQRHIRYVPTGSEAVMLRTRTTALQGQMSATRLEAQTLQLRTDWPSPELEFRVGQLQNVFADLEQAHAYSVAQEVEEKSGAWLASTVAADFVAGSGLTVSWEVRDYRLNVPFEASGTVYDILQRLAEPWNQVPGAGVDITAIGTVVHVRPQLVLTPAADLTLTVAESRLTEVELGDRHRLPLIGAVELEGRIEEAGSDPGDPGVIPPIGFAVSSLLEIPFATDTTEGVRTYRMPDRLLVKIIERVFTIQPDGMRVQSKEETTEMTYEDSHYGANGMPTRQPLPLTSSKSISLLRAQPGGGLLLSEMQRERTTWKYNESRQLEVTTTSREQRVDETLPGGGTFTRFPEVEYTVETRTYKTDAWVEVRTARTLFNPKTGATTSSLSDQLQDQAGFAPGGLRMTGWDFTLSGTSPQPPTNAPVQIHTIISSDPTARALRYSNPNLTRYDLEYILDQARLVSGLVEYPLRGRGPALPDVIKGSTLHLTDFVDHDGTPIPLDPAQVRSITFTYEDTREGGRFECAFDAVFYRRE